MVVISPPGDRMENKTRFNIWFAIGAFVAVLLFQHFLNEQRKIEFVPYSEFQVWLEQGKVAEIAIADRYIRGELKEPLPGGKKLFYTTRVDPGLADKLRQYNVVFRGEVESTWLTDVLSWVLPTAFFLGVWMFLLRRMGQQGGLGGGFLAIGKSKAKVFVERSTGVTF